MNYFDIQSNGTLVSNYMNTSRGVSFWDFFNLGYTQIRIFDKDCKNTLTFEMSVDIAISERIYLCELCRAIAYESSGNIRKLMEHSAVLMLMKKMGLTEITHFSVKTQEITTLWTPEDAEALMS